MTQKRVVRIATVLLVGLALASIAEPVLAQKQFKELVQTHFKLSAAQSKCTFCHGDKKGPNKDNLNDFGKAIQADPDMKPLLNKKVGYVYSQEELAILAKVIEKLGDKDSDGDGVSNAEEIALGTMPGDAKSTPSKADVDEYRKKNPPKAAAANPPDEKKK